MATYLINRLRAAVQTTDATVTSCGTFTLPDATIMDIIARVVARRPSNGDSASFYVLAAVKRHAAGGATLVGVPVAVVAPRADAGAATWAVTIDVTGNDVRVRVTGQLAATIEWMSAVEIALLTP